MSAPASSSRAGSSDPRVTGPIRIVANLSAGKGRGADALRAVEETLRERGAAFEVVRTQGAGDATRFAAEAAQAGVGVVAALGGDGTLHEVLAGLMADATVTPPLLGVIPVGTGNDYARMLGLAGIDPVDAATTLVDGDPWPVDVGRLDGGDRGPEFFCNNVGLAFMANANAAHEESRYLPGRLSYSLGGFAAFLAFQPDLLTVQVDDVSLQGRFMVVHLALGRFCGGGICLTPDAALDDGELHVCLIAERSKLKLFLQWPQIAAGKRLDDMAIVRGRRVRVHGPRDMLAHADGEVRRVPTGVLEATVLPHKLRVLQRT